MNVLTFDFRILFMVDSLTARCPGPVTAKRAKIMIPSITMFMLICVWVLSNVALCILVKHLNFGLVHPKEIVQM